MRSRSTKGTGTAGASATSIPSPTSGSGGDGHPSWFIGGVGIAMCAFWVVGVLAQVQTNEAMVTGASVENVWHPNFLLLAQVPNLFIGSPSNSEAAATIVGWGIELVYLGFIIGYEKMHYAVSKSGQLWAKIFRALAWGIVLFNGWTDYKYGTLGGGEWGHLLFALVMSFIVGFFGTIGFHLISTAWNEA